MDLDHPLVRELLRLGVVVQFVRSLSTSTVYLYCRLRKYRHPKVGVRIGDHEPNPARLKTAQVDLDFRLDDLRWPKALAQTIHTLLMRRWACKRARKPKHKETT